MYAQICIHTLADDSKMLSEVFETLLHQGLVQFEVLLTPELHQHGQQVQKVVRQTQLLLLVPMNTVLR